jgi:hypothetical protein
MTIRTKHLAVALTLALVALPLVRLGAQDIKVDLSKETVGKAPQVFEPMMGTWIVVQDGADKVIKVDGSQYAANKSMPERLIIENSRKLYGTANEELMDNAKQFTFYPVAVLKTVSNFTNGTISLKFKTVSGEADRASGILFNVKPNGDWLCVRYNDTENNVGLWEFHNGVRRLMRFSQPQGSFKLDRAAWHELKMTVADGDFKSWVDGTLAVSYALGSAPGPGRNGNPPNADLLPENNPVIRPPVMGKVGLWAKTDTTSLFKDYVISPSK